MTSRVIRVSQSVLHARTLRFRLTLLYGTLFLVSGAGLLAIAYVLVAAALPIPIVHQAAAPLSGAAPRAFLPQVEAELLSSAAQQHAAELQLLLVRSGIALAIMAVVSVALGWMVAGRALRPLRIMAAATQRISAESLHQRLDISGPRDELKNLADTIDALLARLEGAFDAQRNFVANASHELRTPLTLARALLQMRLRDPHTTAESFRTTCEEVLTAGEQQERLIESLLTLARSQRGLDHREPVDLAAVTSDVAETYEPIAAIRGVRLEIAVRPASVSGDPTLAERLVANLIENAIYHNVPHGCVKILVEARNGQAALQVRNTGPLLSAPSVSRLLHPFQRDAEDRVGDHEGLGLGLSIVAAIAKAHGAALDVRPGAAGGLEVNVEFPATTALSDVVAGTASPTAALDESVLRW